MQGLTSDFPLSKARGRPGLGLTESSRPAIHSAPEMLQLTKKGVPRIAQIISTARYLPEHVVTNAELTARVAALGRPDVINKLAARTGIALL
jgi:hypothetical protein